MKPENIQKLSTAHAHNAPLVGYAEVNDTWEVFRRTFEHIAKGKTGQNPVQRPHRIPYNEFTEQFTGDMSDEWTRTPIVGEVDSKTGKITCNSNGHISDNM